MKYQDEIITEVWRNRETYATRYHHNLREIVADLQKRQRTPFTSLVDRRNRTTDSNVQKQAALRPISAVESPYAGNKNGRMFRS